MLDIVKLAKRHGGRDITHHYDVPGQGEPSAAIGFTHKQLAAFSRALLEEAANAVRFAIKTESALAGNKAWAGLLSDIEAAIALQEQGK